MNTAFYKRRRNAVTSGISILGGLDVAKRRQVFMLDQGYFLS